MFSILTWLGYQAMSSNTGTLLILVHSALWVVLVMHMHAHGYTYELN